MLRRNTIPRRRSTASKKKEVDGQQEEGGWGYRRDERARLFSSVLVVSLAVKKRLFLNARRKRLLVSLFGKKLCDINEWLASF